MKIRIETKALTKALAQCVVQRGATTLDYLRHVLLRADGSELRITSTDLEATVESRVPCEVERGGAVTAQHDLLVAATKGVAGDQPVTLATEGEAALTVTHPAKGRRAAVFSIPTLPADGFPALDMVGEAVPVPWEAPALAEAIAAVRYAVAKQDVRYYLRGVCVCGRYVAASDGYRMALVEHDAPDNAGEMILPGSAIGAVLQALARPDAAVHALKAADGPVAMRVQAEGLTLWTKLIDGRYPDMDRIMRPTRSRALTVLGEELAAALGRLEPFARRAYSRSGGGTYYVSPVTLTPRADMLTIDAVADGGARATEHVPAFDAVAVNDDTPSINFDLRFLIDIARATPEEIVWRWSDTGQTSAAPLFEINRYQHFLMPVR